MSRNKATRMTRNQIFLKKLISTFIVCALFAASLVFTLLIYIRGEMFSGSYQITEIMREAFANDIGGKAFARMTVTTISYHEDVMDSFVAIYDENGEYYIYPEDTVTLRVSKDSEADFHFYDLADSAGNSLDELKEKYKPGQDNDDVVYLTNPYTLSRFCLIDETFIPLEVVVTDNEKTETIVIDAEIPEGAEIYTSDMVTQAKLLFNYTNINKEDFSYISQRIISNQSIVTDFNSITNISRIEIDGKDYFIGETQILNIGFILKRAIVVILPITLLVFIIIAILRTSKEYAVLSAHYAIEDHRREMTDRLAHDLKSPLMVISGYAENLSENVNPENRQHYAEAILENVKYMDNIIADVLDLSKLEDGAVKTNSEAFDAAAIIKELGANYEDCFRKNEVKFTYEGSAAFTTDKSLMKTILDNLMSNAVKYTDKGGSITVKCESGKVCITNTCADADKLDFAKLAEPFVKGDNSRSGRKGSGLGLSIASCAASKLGLKLSLSAENGMFKAEISKK